MRIDSEGALTEQETGAFQALAEGFQHHGEHIALIRSQLDGQNVAVVSAVLELPDGSFDITPLAVLVSDDLFDRLADPASLVA